MDSVPCWPVTRNGNIVGRPGEVVRAAEARGALDVDLRVVETGEVAEFVDESRVEFRGRQVGNGIRRAVLEQAVHDGFAAQDTPLCGVDRARSGKADHGCLVHAERDEDRSRRVVDDRTLVAVSAIAVDSVVFSGRVHVAAGKARDVMDETGAVIGDARRRHALPDGEHALHARTRRALRDRSAQRAVVGAVLDRRRRVPDEGRAVRADRERSARDGDARGREAREQRDDPAGTHAHPGFLANARIIASRSASSTGPLRCLAARLACFGVSAATGLSAAREAVEEPQVVGAIDRNLAPGAVAFDVEAALIHAGRAREAVLARRDHEEEEILALAVARRVVAVAHVPDVLTEGVGSRGVALQGVVHAQRDDDGVEVRELRMLLDTRADDGAAHDVAGAVGELVEVARHGHRTALREGGRCRDAGDEDEECALGAVTHGVG